MAVHCTRGLAHVFASHPPPSMMPVDLAACLTLRQPLHPLLSPLRATQRLCTTSTHSPRRPIHPSYVSPSEPRSCLRRDTGGLKKRVVFADARGLALTAVRLYIPEPISPSYLPSTMFRPFGAKQETPIRRPAYKLRLAFVQPSLDYKVFLSRLKEVGMQLESCSISENCLSGRVRVSHVRSEQTVCVKVSFDSWRSHHNIPCTFLQTQRCGALDTDIYTFDLSLPLVLEPLDGIEFCVSSISESSEVPKWDDNRGQNYRIHVEKDSSSEPADKTPGSPKLSRYQRPYKLTHMTPVDVQSYAKLPYLETLSRLGMGWEMCPVK